MPLAFLEPLQQRFLPRAAQDDGFSAKFPAETNNTLKMCIPAVIKVSNRLQPIRRLRLLLACCYLSALLYYISEFKVVVSNSFISIPEMTELLPRLILLQHFWAATGLDESAVYSLTAHRPYIVRQMSGLLYSPGFSSPVTPLFSFLPKTHTAASSLAWMFHVSYTLILVIHGANFRQIQLNTVFFLIASIFDIGFFYSTRPGDLIKYAFALTLPQGHKVALYLCATLYFWSGFWKLRRYFWDWIFQYNFLLFGPVSHLFRNFIITKKGLPLFWTKVFGFSGVFLELLQGVGIILAMETNNVVLLILSILVSVAMHLFIFFFGLGPYRWNTMQMFMDVALLITIGSTSTDFRFLAGTASPEFLSLLYVFVFGIFIPVVAACDPVLAGKYLGGYRMATFHFCGNEGQYLLFLRKSALRRALLKDDKYQVIQGVPLLKLLNKTRLEGGPSRFSATEEFRIFPYHTDGFDVVRALEEGLKITGEASFKEFDEKFVCVDANWSYLYGPLLSTKPDESLLPVRNRFFELITESLDPLEATDACLLLVEPSSVFDPIKHFRIFDLKDASNEYKGGFPFKWY